MWGNGENYEKSNKYVRSVYIGEQYLQKVIRENANIRAFSLYKNQNGKPMRY